MAEKKTKVDWTKEQIEMGFAMEIGKCIETEGGADFGDGDPPIEMEMRLCRISEDELEITGQFEFDEGEPTTIHSKYRRNVDR